MKSYRFIHLLYLLFLSVSLVSCDKDNDSEVLSHLFFGEESGKSGDDTGDKDDKYDQSKQYVDLGLSVKWAVCNLGAKQPQDYGDYYAWGEIETKTSFNWLNYKFYNANTDKLTKYCTSSSYGDKDNRTSLTDSDDAASVLCGTGWRMPTHDEIVELFDHCSFTITTYRGTRGTQITSETNGESIFIPYAGYYEEKSIKEVKEDFYLWSKELYAQTPSHAICFNSNHNTKKIQLQGIERFYGFQIRAVYTGK
ncbi:MAG: hypothetical protein IKH58_00105 [Bacteroidales bacterium]|nr:hypothetical protein [Bacteroidales bacterium]